METRKHKDNSLTMSLTVTWKVKIKVLINQTTKIYLAIKMTKNKYKDQKNRQNLTLDVETLKRNLATQSSDPSGSSFQ